jgi:hypothetical protein
LPNPIVAKESDGAAWYKYRRREEDALEQGSHRAEIEIASRLLSISRSMMSIFSSFASNEETRLLETFFGLS